ncbi:MAG: dehydrogenase, partial [Candidatus Thermoplasmatota archaeon]|nr:dehydrogenase [Candidatus Thermoplasmatota archaeon]
KARGMHFPESARYMLIVDISSTRESLQRQLDEAVAVLRQFSPTDITVTTDPAEMARIYEARKGAYASLLSERSSPTERVVIGDIVVPASSLPMALKESEEKLKEDGVRAALFGHIADGNIHANIFADTGNAEQMKKVDRFQMDLGKIALKYGGSVSAEHGIGMEKKELLRMELDSSGNPYVMEIMKTIRRSFDPMGIMNRGKMFD